MDEPRYAYVVTVDWPGPGQIHRYDLVRDLPQTVTVLDRGRPRVITKYHEGGSNVLLDETAAREYLRAHRLAQAELMERRAVQLRAVLAGPAAAIRDCSPPLPD